VVCGDHAEAVLILGGVEKIADEGTGRVRVAKWFALQRVNPGVVFRFIRAASQESEILEEY
jgi:hypothetical protein